MDIAYEYAFAEEVLDCVIGLLPLKCDRFDEETVATWMYTISTNKRPIYLKYLPQILVCYANWLGNENSLGEDYIVGMITFIINITPSNLSRT